MHPPAPHITDSYQPPELDSIFREAYNAKNFMERAQWLSLLFSWLHKTSWTESLNDSADRLRALRFKFFVTLLQKNELHKTVVVHTIAQLLTEMDFIQSFSNVGYGHHASFFQELNERIIEKLLPSAPIQEDFTTLLLELFPHHEETQWLNLIDEDSLKTFISFFDTSETLKIHLANNLNDSMVFLISQIHAFGLSTEFRRRSKSSSIRSSPFYQILERDLKSPEQFKAACDHCHEAVEWSKNFLDENGISISLIFQIERAKKQIQRLATLNSLFSQPALYTRTMTGLIKEIVDSSLNGQSIAHLFTQNFQLLAIKVVDRNSEAGENYKISDYKDYMSFIKKSAGGGIIMSAATLIKNALMALPLSPFMNGLFFSLNYSVSFLLIQFFSFTLATKQPSSTAAAIANKIQDVDKSGYQDLVEEIIAILRAQIICIIGNLIMVGPGVAAINLAFYFFSGKFLVSKDTAHHLIHSADIFGPSAFFAAFTGVLLFSSSIIAGWVDNWFIYRNLDERILNHIRIGKWVGYKNLKTISVFFKNNIAAMAANVSLGFLLGLFPIILKFLGLPLEVRHVTLSMGSLALGLSSILDSFSSAELTRALVGLFSIGFLNVAVSFYCAFRFATAAKRVRFYKRKIIYAAVLRAILKKPQKLLFP